jgi:hypothetical protein
MTIDKSECQHAYFHRVRQDGALICSKCDTVLKEAPTEYTEEGIKVWGQKTLKASEE